MSIIFEHISHLVLVFLLLTLSRWIPARYMQAVQYLPIFPTQFSQLKNKLSNFKYQKPRKTLLVLYTKVGPLLTFLGTSMNVKFTLLGNFLKGKTKMISFMPLRCISSKLRRTFKQLRCLFCYIFWYVTFTWLSLLYNPFKDCPQIPLPIFGEFKQTEFYSPWNYRKIQGFLMILGGIKVN